MNDIFDISNTEDLPNSIVEELSKDNFEKEILEMFRIANRPLYIDEVFVGYFRKYKKTINKRKIVAKLYRMSHSGILKLKRVKGAKGYYELLENDDEKHI